MPDFCARQDDGTLLCAPPKDCADASGTCRPPPFCEPTAAGKYVCKPPAPNATRDSASAPRASCEPDADGALRCAPPSDCGGAAFAGAGAAGCAPPAFCSAAADGRFDCKPPEDCRAGAGGWQRCFGAPVGDACRQALRGFAQDGDFVPCGAAPTLLCSPPSAGATTNASTCRAPPLPPHFCAADEPQFHANGSRGGASCIVPPRIENGTYLPPEAAHADCVPPPPGEWPPEQPAPEGKVYCPPRGFAPPPSDARDLRAFLDYSERVGAAPDAQRLVQALTQRYANLTATQLDELTNASAAHRLFAPPAFDGRSMNGSFVTGGLDDGMRLRNFTVEGTRFFRDARPGADQNASFSTSAGPAIVASGGDVLVESHNAPSGLLAYRSAGERGYNVSFTPEAGYNLTRERGLVMMEKDGWRGVLVGNATLAPNGSIDARVDPRTPAFFMAVPPSGLEAKTRLDIARGVADRKVFGEVSLVRRGDAIAQDLTVYDDASKFRVNVTNATPDAIRVHVDGEGEGQALVLTVDRSTLTTPLADLNVTIDDVAIPECATFEALENASGHGGCYKLDANESVVRVDVMPEHFSSHTITLGAIQTTQSATAPSAPATPSPQTTASAQPTTTAGAPTPAPSAKTPGPGLAALIGAALVAVAIIARRRNR